MMFIKIVTHTVVPRIMSLRLLLTLVFLAASPMWAQAHRMTADVLVQGDQVQVIAGYDDDMPAEQATVTIKNAQEEVIAEGTTDDSGLCLLPRPIAGTYTIITNDHAGHLVKVTIEIPEDPASAPVTTVSVKNDRRIMAVIGILGITVTTMSLRRIFRYFAPHSHN